MIFKGQAGCFSLVTNLLPTLDSADMLPVLRPSLYKSNPNPASLLASLTYGAQLSTAAHGPKSVRVGGQPSGCPRGEVGMMGFASSPEQGGCRHRLLSSLGRLYPESKIWSPNAEVKRNGLFNHWLLPFHPLSFHLFPTRRLRTDQSQLGSAQVTKILETKNPSCSAGVRADLGLRQGDWPPKLSPQIISVFLKKGDEV